MCVYCTDLTRFTDICSPTHSSRAAPIIFVGLGLRSSSSPHFRGRTLKVFGMLRGEYGIIQGVVEWLIALHSKTLPRTA